MYDIVTDFAAAFKAVDASAPVGKSRTRIYRPGIGPLGEEAAIDRALQFLKSDKPARYANAGPKRYPGLTVQCDVVIPNEWALEFKLIRPFGDNGDEAEHWSENILHPYEGNVSSIGDALKLMKSNFAEQRGILVFGYEHTPAKIDLTVAVAAFELVATQIAGIQLGERNRAEFDSLIHPVHQQGKVFGWQVL